MFISSRNLSWLSSFAVARSCGICQLELNNQLCCFYAKNVPMVRKQPAIPWGDAGNKGFTAPLGFQMYNSPDYLHVFLMFAFAY